MKTLTLHLKDETAARLEDTARRFNLSVERLLEYYVNPETERQLSRIQERQKLMAQLQAELNRPQAYDPELTQELDNTLSDGLQGR